MIVMVSASNALSASQDDTTKHYNLGVELYKKGDLDGAIAEYRIAIRLNPNLPNAHYHLGIALMDQGNVSAAAKELEEFIRLAPNMPFYRSKIDEAKRRLNKLRVSEK